MSNDLDQIQRARDLAPMLAEADGEIERRRELPEQVVAALIKGGFFRMLQPRFLGGAELRPVIFTQVTEALAQTNASVAWCVGQNNGCSMSAAYLDPRGRARNLRPADGDPGLGAAGRAVRGAAGRWRLSHQRQMALRQRLPECKLARRAYARRRDAARCAPCCSPRPAPR